MFGQTKKTFYLIDQMSKGTKWLDTKTDFKTRYHIMQTSKLPIFTIATSICEILSLVISTYILKLSSSTCPILHSSLLKSLPIRALLHRYYNHRRYNKVIRGGNNRNVLNIEWFFEICGLLDIDDNFDLLSEETLMKIVINFFCTILLISLLSLFLTNKIIR